MIHMKRREKDMTEREREQRHRKTGRLKNCLRDNSCTYTANIHIILTVNPKR